MVLEQELDYIAAGSIRRKELDERAGA